MKISNNALNFLLAQYRAIFKRAYVKGIASAVLLTAGLAAGQAQAVDQPTAGLDDGNDYYYYNSGSTTWAEYDNKNNNYLNNNGIVAGAIGGDGLTGADSLPLEKENLNVTGGTLKIDGTGTAANALASGSQVLAVGAYAQSSTTNVTAKDNKVEISGTGYIDRGTANDPLNRGAVFGAFAQSKVGQAFALGNTITVKKSTDVNTRAAASHGFIGAQAQGHTGATASGNTVEITGAGTDANKRQILSLSDWHLYRF